MTDERVNTVRRDRSSRPSDDHFDQVASHGCATPCTGEASRGTAKRVAVLSFLFNWPTTGGGVIHTVELCDFLARAGFQVRHFFARNADWGVGRVESPLPFSSLPIECHQCCTAESVTDAFRAAVRRFDPHGVIISDSWNFKPYLAAAVADYPYVLRQQALECLCPLNNLRLLPAPGNRFEQCAWHQLAQPRCCRECITFRDKQSGPLHRLERALSRVGSNSYEQLLRRALWRAEAVFVLNPVIAQLLDSYCRRVEVVTWGMDPARFPWPWPEPDSAVDKEVPLTVLMAGLADDPIKGYHVLHQACRKLWTMRQDFRLLVTGNPAGRIDEFTQFTGWRSQGELPALLRSSDVLVMPTIAQEGLGRTTVEAMAVGRPVIASRIGGLPFTVDHGKSGWLFEPGNSNELCSRLDQLLSDAPLRNRMGLAGRRRFERDFTWPTVIDRHYRPLLDGLPAARELAEHAHGNR